MSETEERAPRPRRLSLMSFLLAVLGAMLFASGVQISAAAWGSGRVDAIAVAVVVVSFPLAILVGAAGLYFQRRWAQRVLLVTLGIAAFFTIVLLAQLLAIRQVLSPPGALAFLQLAALASAFSWLRRPHVRASLA